MLQCAPSHEPAVRPHGGRPSSNSTDGAKAMTPERRKLARRAFERALKLAPAQRSAFIEETCADDAELRAEVESMLASHEAAHATEADTSRKRSGRRSRAKTDTLPEIIPGRTTLGAYNVLEKLGSG